MQKTILALIVCAISLVPVTSFGARLYPNDLTFSGSFRLPDGTRNGAAFSNGYMFSGMGWDASSSSLLLVGRVDSGTSFVEAVTPATPIISAGKLATELNIATTTTGKAFADVTGGIQSGGLLLSDVDYMPQQGSQTTAKYYWTTFFDYAVADDTNPRLGWSDTDFSAFNATGMWALNGVPSRQYDKYLTPIDSTWATANLGGPAIAVGRGRTNGSFGPSLFAMQPWVDGNPPTAVSTIGNTVLMAWDKDHTMQAFGYDTTFGDAVWINKNGKSAVVVLANMSYRYDATCAACTEVGADRWWTSSGTGRSTAYKTKEGESTTITTLIDAAATSIAVANTSIFSPSGKVKVDSEYISYSSISGNSLIGCTRGLHSTTPASHSVGIAVTQVMPDVFDYGGFVDGFDALVRMPMLLFFDPDQLAQVVTGTIQPYEVQPYAYMLLDQYFYNAQSRDGTWKTNTFHNGITWDGSRLFVGEWNGYPDGYSKNPLIHAFDVTANGSGADTAAPSGMSNAAVTSGGVVSWTPGATPGNVYVIYKWFHNAYKTTSEYRPIRVVTGTSWTDPLYTAGDTYQIIAYSREMVASSPVIASLSGETPISGVCGSSNNLSLPSAPTTGLCSAGTASAVSGSGPWTWTCAGSGGGSTANCGATLLEGPAGNAAALVACPVIAGFR